MIRFFFFASNVYNIFSFYQLHDEQKGYQTIAFSSQLSFFCCNNTLIIMWQSNFMFLSLAILTHKKPQRDIYIISIVCIHNVSVSASFFFSYTNNIKYIDDG
jgi:hypothetical protein